ncbi:ABC transporter permease [Sphingomonas jeddahensis]|uniref:ABC-2 family transporter protein n=1 Tax=Sphingomonas jeddahensis TaxID=1915074 RepID=A0A1V2EVR7_9SPHN|nr:ABC transporter permease [Sphingomonas jeddahensis]ONF96643.1 ABC-2 family transporter protein [Sphingomonas jeddahensis]
MSAPQSQFGRRLRQTLTIARRDFTATVFTPIFLLFLFAPVIMGSFGAIGGLGAASVSAGSAQKERLVAIAEPRNAAALVAADRQLRRLFSEEANPPPLDIRTPERDTAAQAKAALNTRDGDVVAVLHGPLEAPGILFGRSHRPARYLAVLAEQALRVDRTGAAQLSRPTFTRNAREAPSLGGRNASAFFAVFGIFFLTLFLSGQVVGTMAEERNNKVIEVLAAAVPLESVFLGKLLGMFGVAVLFVGFWGTVVSQIGALLPPDVNIAELTPAVGFSTFALLFAAYFTTAYLLLGSVFLGIGAQASTMREIQMLSLPITILQVGMFALSSAAASKPGSWIATAAELFPLSSPFAMAGHAANAPDLWPHLAALAWQLLWVTIFITVGARLFRRGVLQSGSPAGAWKKLFRRAGDRTGY